MIRFVNITFRLVMRASVTRGLDGAVGYLKGCYRLSHIIEAKGVSQLPSLALNRQVSDFRFQIADA